MSKNYRNFIFCQPQRIRICPIIIKYSNNLKPGNYWNCTRKLALLNPTWIIQIKTCTWLLKSVYVETCRLSPADDIQLAVGGVNTYLTLDRRTRPLLWLDTFRSTFIPTPLSTTYQDLMLVKVRAPYQNIPIFSIQCHRQGSIE